MNHQSYTPRRKPFVPARSPNGTFAAVSVHSSILGDDEHYSTMRAWIADQGTHPYEAMIASWGQLQPDVDRYTLSITCFGCDQTWDAHIGATELWAERANWAWVQDWLAPFLKSIASAPCFRLRLLTELAEWLTEEVRAAGDLGITYSELVSTAVSEHLCAPSDVDVVLERLGFLPFGAVFVPVGATDLHMDGARLLLNHDEVIRLPIDHPLHPRNPLNCEQTDYEWED